MQNSLSAMDTCEEGNTIELFRRGDRPGEFVRLDADIRKLQHLASNSDVFGTQAEWGDILTRRRDKLQPNETHNAHTTSTGEPVVIKEVFDIGGLRSYIPHCGKDRTGAFESLRNSAIPITRGEELAEIQVPYSDAISYGRKYARGAPCQKIGRVGGNAVFRRRASDEDICNCHPSLVRILLRRAYAPDNTHGKCADAMYHMLNLATDNYIEWREFCAEYYGAGPKKAKAILNSIIYGRNVTGGVPFLHALMLEIRKAAEYLCNHTDYVHLQMYYDRGISTLCSPI